MFFRMYAAWAEHPRLRLGPTLRGDIEATLQATIRYHLERDLKSWAFLQQAAHL